MPSSSASASPWPSPRSTRLIACLLQAFSADAADPLPPPPSYEEMHQVLLRYDKP